MILRVVITDDWLMYWDPWISDIKEMGFSYLATDRYDYTPTFIYILWVISKLPMNPMTAYKGLHCILDFVAAADFGQNVYKVTGSRRKGVLSYGLFLIVPTIWANSAPLGPVRHHLHDLFTAVLLLPVCGSALQGHVFLRDGLCVQAPVPVYFPVPGDSVGE